MYSIQPISSALVKGHIEAHFSSSGFSLNTTYAKSIFVINALSNSLTIGFNQDAIFNVNGITGGHYLLK
ncbi:hypothetical protein [Pseudoalteromonas luteoviolacea]|uniref:hypothetical protein n=1 Tax=Pseudoalteromonas luteoviolacea TaxID=43657 RepID=UPI001B37AC1F|nr:hypothetical protein [Pseudoalteromonas luteoviolacea]MBQ4835437.1 hypothetical protein [Pseudoalteromonas luteoviolacea]